MNVDIEFGHWKALIICCLVKIDTIFLLILQEFENIFIIKPSLEAALKNPINLSLHTLQIPRHITLKNTWDTCYFNELWFNELWIKITEHWKILRKMIKFWHVTWFFNVQFERFDRCFKCLLLVVHTLDKTSLSKLSFRCLYGRHGRTIKSGVIGNLVIVAAMKNSRLGATTYFTST